MDLNWQEIFKKINQYKRFLGIVFVVIAILVLYFINQQKTVISEPNKFKASIQKSSSQSKQIKSATSNKIFVDIKGQINQPGVYQLDDNLLINDAIKIAGGATADADLNQINLAQKLQDEMVIYIPKAGEENPNQSAINNSADSTNSQSNSKININSADLSQLQDLNGVGEKKAAMIIEYRNQNGKFKSVDDLANIKGFGTKTIDNLREQVIV